MTPVISGSGAKKSICNNKGLMFNKLKENSIGALLFHQDQMKHMVNSFKEMKRAIKLQKDLSKKKKKKSYRTVQDTDVTSKRPRESPGFPLFIPPLNLQQFKIKRWQNGLDFHFICNQLPIQGLRKIYSVRAIMVQKMIEQKRPTKGHYGSLKIGNFFSSY